MKILVSGYGSDSSADTIAIFENGVKLWGEYIDSPSFIAFSDSGKYMYTITEARYAKVYSYEIGESGIKKLDELEVPGTVLCHITYSERYKLLIGSCYGTGNVFTVKVKNGKFEEVRSTDESVPKNRPEGTCTRAHCALLNHAENMLAVANIALDMIYLYSVSPNGLEECGYIELYEGCGPRHLVYGPDEKKMYVITEYSNEIIVIDMCKRSVITSVSTLPFGISAKSNCSAICFSPDCKFLYGANRFTGTIVRFKLDSDGIPCEPMWFRCGNAESTKNTRHMRMFSDWNLVAANQDSGEVIIYKLSSLNGMPELSDSLFFRSASDAVLIK